MRERIFVPTNENRTIIKLYHEGVREGHQEASKTPIMWQEIGWSKMQQDVAEYVRNCNKCQRNNLINHKPRENANEKIPRRTWKQIMTKFIKPFTRIKRSDNRRKV